MIANTFKPPQETWVRIEMSFEEAEELASEIDRFICLSDMPKLTKLLDWLNVTLGEKL